MKRWILSVADWPERHDSALDQLFKIAAWSVIVGFTALAVAWLYYWLSWLL